jgi:recombinational DNA repair protein (RecF pathway)
MYTKHHTRSIVLGKYDRGEADRVYVLLTPDLGKIYAQAHGVRRASARNKGALQTLSKASVSLVRGKTGWRITNASATGSLYREHAQHADTLAALVRVLKLAHRLLAGEGGAHEVFAILESFAEALEVSTKNEQHDSALFETLAVVRMLHALGYVQSQPALRVFLDTYTDYSPETLALVEKNRKAILAIINHALEASQL